MADTTESVLIGGVAGLISGLASAVLTYFSTKAKLRLDLAAEYDKQLQEARLAAYLELWPMLEPLARYGRDKPITHEVLTQISRDTRGWYFRSGIYLTHSSRGTYFNWKKLMQLLLDNPEYARTPKVPIQDRETSDVLYAASVLRRSLSDDIGTRNLSRL